MPRSTAGSSGASSCPRRGSPSSATRRSGSPSSSMPTCRDDPRIESVESRAGRRPGTLVGLAPGGLRRGAAPEGCGSPPELERARRRSACARSSAAAARRCRRRRRSAPRSGAAASSGWCSRRRRVCITRSRPAASTASSACSRRRCSATRSARSRRAICASTPGGRVRLGRPSRRRRRRSPVCAASSSPASAAAASPSPIDELRTLGSCGAAPGRTVPAIWRLQASGRAGVGSAQDRTTEVLDLSPLGAPFTRGRR